MNIIGRIKRRAFSEIHSSALFKRKNNLQFIRHAFFYKERQEILKQLQPEDKLELHIPANKGLLQWDTSVFPVGKALLEQCNQIIANEKPQIDKLHALLDSGNIPADFLSNPFYQPNLKPYLTIDNPLIRFGLHPSILKAAGEYLGMLPILTGVYLLYSPNKGAFKKSSQLFHLDMHDRRCMKIFVYINDVNENCGPLTAIPGNLSEKIEKKLHYKDRYVLTSGDLTSRVEDPTIEAIVPKDKFVTFTGKPGSALFVDTDRCFHYGSRMASKPRIALQYYYETPFGFGFPPNFSDESLFTLKRLAADTNSRIEKLALGDI
jgi:hypothetical protein